MVLATSQAPGEGHVTRTYSRGRSEALRAPGWDSLNPCSAWAHSLQGSLRGLASTSSKRRVRPKCQVGHQVHINQAPKVELLLTGCLSTDDGGLKRGLEMLSDDVVGFMCLSLDAGEGDGGGGEGAFGCTSQQVGACILRSFQAGAYTRSHLSST
jgi:hypothetical protein